MRDNDTMTVRSPTGERYELVDYVDDLLYERLADLPAGATVRLELRSIEDCDRICMATRLVSGSRPVP